MKRALKAAKSLLLSAMKGLILLSVACSDSTGPTWKDPRTYSWTIDTLMAGGPSLYTSMYKIYGAHSRDVYTAGWNDYYGIGALWHFDGDQWSPVQWWKPGGLRQADFSDVMGFDPADIYAVGSQYLESTQAHASLIAHFDGHTWSQTILNGNRLQAIGGSSPTDIWAAGVSNSVFHFDGTFWSKVEVNERLWFSDITAFDGRTFAQAYRIDDFPLDTTWFFLLEWQGANWDTLATAREIVGMPFSPDYGVHVLTVIGNKLYSGSGYPNTSIYRLEGNRWVKFADVSGGVFGTSSENIFNVNGFGGVRHFNGIDWYSYPRFETLPFRLTRAWTDGKEVFIVGNDDTRTVILHGR